ncbi:MAG: MFS transporter [Acidobacteria bacterium]|uniref:MFS transporter n=1 Tax=Candidatus Polarisedimenticola svalbardensis TaxID=2886004 RepID=A0A8J6XZ66_9BACT|nr:MFS transporter [Candidatus Polarisedimenticola svalbardensis]
MLRRFALYGFLKNQRYFEPFLLLVFLEKGLDFFQIGLLIGFRELCVNLMEVPSGAAADLYGRRRSMLLSFSAYIASFVVFALADSIALLSAAMFLFAIGEAFRTGTHKAMILDWLNREGRGDERTRVYGFTRSWSKIGSALSVLIAAGLVFWTGRYSTIFWFSIPPYALALVNFLGYPAWLDRAGAGPVTVRKAMAHLGKSVADAFRNARIRRLVLESSAFEGTFRAGKDYLQPVLQQVAIGIPLLVSLPANRRSALLIGAVYAVLHLLSSLSALNAYRLAGARGGEDGGSLLLWGMVLVVYLVLVPAFHMNILPLAVAGFVALAAAQSLWRPIIVSRFHRCAPAGREATILSIESQSNSAATMVLAPVVGFLVERTGFASIGITGAVLAGVILAGFYTRRR